MAVCSLPVSAVFGRPAFSAFAAVVSVYECYLLLGNQWPNFIRGLPVLINLYISIRLWVWFTRQNQLWFRFMSVTFCWGINGTSVDQSLDQYKVVGVVHWI